MEASIILKLHDTCGGYGECLCNILDQFSNYEIIILDTTPSSMRKARHCRVVENRANFVYTTLSDAIEQATGDYIAILDLDELPSDLSKIVAVRREFINLEEE